MKKYIYKKQIINKFSPIEVFDILNLRFNYNQETGIIQNIKTLKIYNKLTAKGYIQLISIRFNNIEYQIQPHRLAYYLVTKDYPDLNEIIDHKNCIRNDNCWDNLRKTNSFGNQQNAIKRTNRIYTSIYKGVSIENYKDNIKYVVYIGFNCKSLKIARFKNVELAAKFYDSAARFYHKEFANCNFNEIFIEPKSVEELRLLKQTKFKFS